MATAIYGAYRSNASVLARQSADGRVYVASVKQDLGTGTYTIMQQTAAQAMGVDLALVDVKLGDSRLP